MFEEIGELLGWLIVVSFAGTILNYCVKYVNIKWGKKIRANANGKKVMTFLLKVFVRNHKYFGISVALFMLLHFIIQFSKYGIVWTGCIVAALIIFQALLGITATVKKFPRKGAWFMTHRFIAVLIILGIAYHLIAPFSL